MAKEAGKDKAKKGVKLGANRFGTKSDMVVKEIKESEAVIDILANSCPDGPRKIGVDSSFEDTGDDTPLTDDVRRFGAHEHLLEHSFAWLGPCGCEELFLRGLLVQIALFRERAESFESRLIPQRDPLANTIGLRNMR